VAYSDKSRRNGYFWAFFGIALFAAPPACSTKEEGPATEGDDWVGGKADTIFGIEEGSPEARGILRVANESDFETLDDDVGLDHRAASGIVERRPEPDGFGSLAELAEIPFVKAAAFARLLEYASANGFIGHDLRIATFNIRWFGINGSLFGAFGSETRMDTVRAFFDEHLLAYDVVVFQEIVDKALFMDELLPDRTCVSYDGISGKHQHVVLCHTESYVFEPVEDDGTFALMALRFGNLRPGVHGRLATRDGQPVADIIALHLKAREDSTDVRLEQSAVLAEHVAALRAVSSLPTIVIGDFNTHQAQHTGLDEDDEVLLGEVLAEHLQRVPLPVANTYRERDGTAFRLDQAWISSEIEVRNVDVPGPCNLDFETGADDIDAYFRQVSDHCPVRFELTLP
jgi:hypothetical protein